MDGGYWEQRIRSMAVCVPIYSIIRPPDLPPGLTLPPLGNNL